MASQLARLLGRHDVQCDIALADLEKVTGRKGVDLALIGDTLTRAHHMMHKLELDSSNITAREIYQALCASQATFRGLSYVLVGVNNQVVSFNRHDIDDDLRSATVFDGRSLINGRAALVKELKRRYIVAADDAHRHMVERIFTQYFQ